MRAFHRASRYLGAGNNVSLYEGKQRSPSVLGQATLAPQSLSIREIQLSRRACKPGSVRVPHLRAALRRSSLCDIRLRTPDATMCGKRAGRSRRRSGESLAVLLRVGFARPASLDAAGALLPHHFTLADARSRISTALRRFVSVALSFGSPRQAVSRHPCPAEPGLSSSLLRDPRSPGALDLHSIPQRSSKEIANRPS
jgi:hypothetical protein